MNKNIVIILFSFFFKGASLQASSLDENFHSAMYIDDPRVTQLKGHIKLLDGFSRKLFKQSNSCFSLDDFKGTQQSNITLEFTKKIVGTNIFNPFFSEYYNKVYNSHVEAILRAQDLKSKDVFQIALHKTTFARERDTEYVSLLQRYRNLIKTGDFFTFGELCGSGYINSFKKYTGTWFSLVYDKNSDGNDEGFKTLIETYLRLFDSTMEPKLRAQVNSELAKRSVRLYAEFRGMNPLTIPILNLRDIKEFRDLITRIKSAMLSSDAGLYMAMEYTPWGYHDEFQSDLYEFLSRIIRRPDSIEPNRRQWFNFYQNIELARMMSDAYSYESSYVDQFRVCRNQMVRDYPLNKQNQNMLFVNHLDPDGTGVPLSQIHKLLTAEALKNLEASLEQLASGAEGSIATCANRLKGGVFMTSYYRAFKECIWFDNFTKTSPMLLNALCPLTPK